jgi:hypothetical protein
MNIPMSILFTFGRSTQTIVLTYSHGQKEKEKTRGETWGTSGVDRFSLSWETKQSHPDPCWAMLGHAGCTLRSIVRLWPQECFSAWRRGETQADGCYPARLCHLMKNNAPPHKI